MTDHPSHLGINAGGKRGDVGTEPAAKPPPANAEKLDRAALEAAMKEKG